MKLKAFRYFLISLLLPIAVNAGNAVEQWPIQGSVTQECAVAVAIEPALYAAASVNTGTLASKLRIRNSEGANVPYAVRPQKKRIVKNITVWEKLKIVNVVQTNGQLVVDVEYPIADNVVTPSCFTALKVETPIKDFEQTVEVSDGNKKVASGVLCDYSKFADLRVDAIPLATSFRRNFRVVFAKPSSEVSDNAFERTIKENGEGRLEAKTVRRGVEHRPFRINSIFVGIPKSITTFEPEKPLPVNAAGKITVDSKEKKTVIDVAAYSMPVCSIVVNALDRNFARNIKVFRRVDSRWHLLTSSKITSVRLPGVDKKSLEVKFGSEIREDVLRLEILDFDNPPLKFSLSPVTLNVVAYDAAFVASPGEKYFVALAEESKIPRYDDVILNYLDGVQDPQRLRAQLPKLEEIASKVTPGGYNVFLDNIVVIVSVFIFILLGCLCMYLLKQSRKLS
jgi:hypothetical protein